LVADPTRTVAMLSEKLRPVPKPAGARTTQALIANLDDAVFRVRELASRELAARVATDSAELTAALAASPSAEVRRRLSDMLKSAPAAWPRLTTDDLRLVRAVGVLEAIGSAEARQLLKALAEGDPYALLTREARKARERRVIAATN
ncbi:MAG TPA: hypothetical protein VKD90_27805, partial [Gemmataceae bacterium]|nr:hypothetical protein [Gemmataceae bacterium]